MYAFCSQDIGTYTTYVWLKPWVPQVGSKHMQQMYVLCHSILDLHYVPHAY